MPISDEAPVISVRSVAMKTYPDGCLRDQLPIGLADARADLEAVICLVEIRHLPLDGEKFAGMAGRIEVDVDALEKRQLSRQVHPDELRIERRRHESEDDG